jgi:putative DNA primase/helicase
MNIDLLLSNFDGVEDDPNGGWKCLCPVHGDTNPSLKISLTDAGMVLLVCQSHACCFADVVAAVGLTAADFRGVDPGTARTIREASSKSPANATDLAQLDALVTQLSEGFASSESCDYAWDRWEIDEDDAALLRLGHVHPVDNHPLMQRQFARVMGISVPLLGFDGKPRGLQRRSLFDPDDRWSTLKNPADDERQRR